MKGLILIKVIKVGNVWFVTTGFLIMDLSLVSDSFLTNEIIKKLFTALYGDENILCFNENSDDAVLNCNGMGILNIDLNNIDLDNNFDEYGPDTIILIRFLA